MIFSKPQKTPYHPCMNEKAHGSIARLHLPVAPKCNILCGYCEKKTGIKRGDLIKPGVCRSIITPGQAVFQAEEFIRNFGKESIIGIAGPGDPLCNKETFKTLSLLKKKIPEIKLCLCTNGLMLPSSIGELKKFGVDHISVTINGVEPCIVQKIHPYIFIDGVKLTGEKAAASLIHNQLKGVTKAVNSGIFVKINTVLIPGINDNHILETAKTLAGLGAGIMNLMPLIPGGLFKNIERPSDCFIKNLSKKCMEYIPIFTKCRQCRADASGVPGKEVCNWKKTA